MPHLVCMAAANMTSLLRHLLKSKRVVFWRFKCKRHAVLDFVAFGFTLVFQMNEVCGFEDLRILDF